MAGGQRDHAAPAAGAAAFAVGHARHRARGILGLLRHLPQRLRAGFLGIVEIEIGEGAARQQAFIGEPGEAVDRRGTGHGHGARRQFVERGISEVARSDRGGGPADENPEADMFGFGAFDVFQRAEADADALRGTGEIDRVTGIGAGTARPFDQGLATRLCILRGQHRRTPSKPAASGPWRRSLAVPGHGGNAAAHTSAAMPLMSAVTAKGRPMEIAQITVRARRSAAGRRSARVAGSAASVAAVASQLRSSRR